MANDSWTLYLRLLKYLKRYWRPFSLSLVAMLIGAATEPMFVSLMQPLIDKGFVDKNLAAISWVPGAIVGLFLLRGVAGYVNDYATSWLTGHLVQALREEMFARLLRLPLAYFNDHATGRLISRILVDVDQVTAAGFNVITVSVKDGVTVLGLLGFLLYTDWQLTMICFIVMPMVALTIRAVSKRLRKLSYQSQLHSAQMTQVLGESIDCQKVVKLYGGEQYEQSRFRNAAADLRKNNNKQIAASSISTGLTQLIVAVALAVVLYFAAARAQLAGGMSAGSFMAFLTAMTALFGPIKRITNISQSLQRGLAAADSVFTFLDQAQEQDQGAREIAKPAGMLSFEQVNFRYANTAVDTIRNFSLTIRAGESVALVGPSGSGKTTLASLVPRFYEPTGGQIRLDGVPLNELSLANLRSHIALVSQEVVLFNDTVAANIAYGMRDQVSHEAIVEAARAANALEFIEKMPEGFDTLIGEDGVRLSGGQRQRLAIARALLKNAPILILDEATSALDNQSERLVQEALEVLMKNRTTIIIAHRLSTIERVDRIVVMAKGEVVEAGKHHELIAKDGLYSKLYSLQFSGDRNVPSEVPQEL